ncbi:biopolymer transporter ExbD [Rhodoblastus acidophilus]|uniref:Biopolymer transporter ExbD n=1 Tax=Candidatus Rhodoblastus alkanivorans TaxID=2954117 RepID=A0ABS9ZAE7_9HYPH|nr:biopolymer transporter ExbD [Candidatus Rhodoblastus alkanivorans]MCI4677829.1 biopolymer transporter ExbD [Candidatus Rhodoblastus alkanivorans]MCI4684673.1 biopolymer transporter ExbD [Candidatus Rhodoblastus alkanivorans]MDI4641995.1 biopolymer transporter ExbD [Rhodoblastus acidophilus]
MQSSSVSKSSGVYQVQAEINVTPLVDVMLVLLIIFMVTAPMMAAGLHVSLPQAKAAQKLDPKPPVVLNFTKDGKVDLDGQDYALDEVVAAVEARLGDNRTQPIQLRADRDASYGAVVGLMDVLASHGLTRLAILTAPDRPGPARPVDQGPARPVDQGPARPGDQGPARPVDQGPARPVDQGPARPVDQQGPARPVDLGPRP